MNKICRLKPSDNINREFGLRDIQITEIRIVPSVLKELEIKIDIHSFDAINDIDKLKKIIDARLSIYSSKYKLSFILTPKFEYSNAQMSKIISFIINFLIITKKSLSILFSDYVTNVDNNNITIYLLQDLLVNQAYKNNINHDISKEIKKIFNLESNIEFKCKTNDISIEKKEEIEYVKVYENTENIILENKDDLVIGQTVEIQGQIFDMDIKRITTKNGEIKQIVKLYITNYETSYICKKLYNEKDNIDYIVSDYVNVKGTYKRDDRYTKEFYIDSKKITKTEGKIFKLIDDSNLKRVELSMKTNMSELSSNINSKKLNSIMKNLGYKAYAVNDLGVVHSFPFLYDKKDDSVKAILGMEAYVVDDNAKLIVNPSDELLDRETYVVFDIETTGLNPYSDKIIEIGAVKIQENKIIEKFSKFINPEIPIPKTITELTSITDDDVKDQDTIDIVLPQFLEFIGKSTLVAHNAKFDIGFVTEKAKQLNINTNFSYIDTIEWAKLTLPDQKRFSLDALCKKFNLVNEHHHRAVNDAEVTAQLFRKLLNLVMNMNVNTLSDVNEKLQLDVKIAPTIKTTILVKNQEGLKDLYELVSKSLVEYFGKGKPRIPKSLLEKKKKNLLISAAPTLGFNDSGELVSMYIRGIDKEEIEESAKFYDYIQIMPANCYETEIKQQEITDENYVIEMNKYFYELGKKLNQKVVAVGNVMYMYEYERIVKSVLQLANKEFKAFRFPTNNYFRTTKMMLDDFSYFDEEIREEIVIKNTNDIADMIDRVRPIPEGFYPPIIEGANEKVEKMTYDKAYELYGENMPEIIKERINKELNSIIGNGFAVLYLIAQKLVKKSIENGYLVGSRGSVGSSIVAYLMGITEVNGLSPHYRCPNKDCKNIEIFDLAKSGVDLPVKNCPKCNTLYIRDGHAIPFEVFMGFNGEKVPDIDLNFSGEFQAEIHKYTEELFGADNVFRAGTISTLAENNAIGYVKKYFEEITKNIIKDKTIERFNVYDKNLDEQNIYREQLLENELKRQQAEILRVARMLEGARKTTGQHPGGMVVIPSNKSIFDFTPYQKPANDLNSDSTTTHFDYHVMDEQLVKLDILGHDDPTTLRNLQDLTNLDIYTIPLTDEKVLSIFSSTDALGVTSEQIGTELGTNGIPEFGTNFVKEMLKDTRPKTFTELVRISGLSHGTDVWLNNAKDYVNSGIATLNDIISVRDDIMNYLILQGMEKSVAFKIMEFVRKGLPSKKKDEWQKYKEMMKSSGIKDWYIESCEKIKYMFPKGHAVAYVMMAMRIAYFKVYYPLEFYTAYLNRKVSDFTLSKMNKSVDELKIRLNELNSISNKTVNDKAEINMIEILIEMDYRNVKLAPVDLYKSEATTFIIDDNKIRIPFVGVDKLGDVVARKIVEERNIKDFSSIEDLLNRTKINKSVYQTLKNNDCINGLNETDQGTLF
ncbi:PolC-type DNA polymerase III [Caviibacter abscessus]|uniref:PolC-type DNA polymerase III n=1 Tax=Caviibacter abscessus TaxID=1766719 RepID=UPI000839488D|nr:PolC-type DNA polymerase III [Caviibacter abscessus]